MKKFISLVVLVILVATFMAVFKNSAVDLAAKEESASSKSDVTTLYGYKLEVLSYDGTGEPKVVSKNGPILVYQEGLLDEVTITYKGDFPHGVDGEKIPGTSPDGNPEHDLTPYEMFSKNEYDVEQWVDPKDPTTEVIILIGGSGDTNTAEDWNNPNNHTQEYDTEFYSNVISGISGGTATQTEAAEAALDYGGTIEGNLFERTKGDVINGCPAESCTTGDYSPPVSKTGTGIKHVTRRYKTSEKKITYPGGDSIKSDVKYYKKIKDHGTASEIVEKYASLKPSEKNHDLTVLEENFGIELDPLKLNTYYVQVEVVQRKFDSTTQIDPQEYVAHTLTNKNKNKQPSIPPTTWDAEGIYRRGSTDPIEWKKSLKCDDGYTYSTENNTCYKCDTGYKLSPYRGICSKKFQSSGVPEGYINNLQNEGYTCNSNNDPAHPLYNCEKTVVVDAYQSEVKYCVKAGTTYCPAGEERTLLFYGIKSKGISSLVVSRKSDVSPNYKAAVQNTCSNNEHKIIDDQGKYKSGSLYYVGPNLEDALVGPKTVDTSQPKLKNKEYKYTLNDATWDGSKYTCLGTNGSPETGIQHFYLIEVGDSGTKNHICKDKCSEVSSNRSSNEYLNCAEQYAEGKVDYDLNGDPRKRKFDTIINECGYTYGESPKNGDKKSSDRESVDSCNNSMRRGIASSYQSSLISFESSCNIANGKYVPDQKAVNAYTCIGDYVTDFDEDDTYDKIFDHRTYINKVCKDTTGFNFKDTSKLILTKGSGFTYPIKQEGEKDCTYFFNLEQWKVDYASAPARDKEKRKRLLDILDVFNKEITNSASNNSSDYVEDFVLDGYGKTKFTGEGFNFGETSINTSVSESIIAKEEKETQNLKMTIEKTSTNSSIMGDKDNKTSTRLQTIAHDTVKVIGDAKISTLDVNRYRSIGEGKITYSLQKVCISTDGLATISQAPSNGICYQRSENGKTTDVLAEDKYYTSFQIDPNKNSSIKAKVSVGADSYYSNNETCSYKVNVGGECKILVEPHNNTGAKLGEGQYKDTQLDVRLKYEGMNYDISNISISDNGTVTNKDAITISKQNSRSVTVHKLVGTVTLKNGNQVSCEETIEQYSVPNSSCNVSCTINAVSNLIYEIKSSTASQYYSYTSNHLTASTDALLKGDNTPYSFMKNLIKPVGSNSYYIRLSEPLKPGETLYGYVTNGNNCNNYCEIKIPIPNEKEKDCEKDYKPTERGPISEYCKTNWNVDVNGYEDDNDCYSKCSTSCPNERSNLKVVTDYCKNEHERAGFADIDSCMNFCYEPEPSEKPKTPTNYIFRSINVLDPFPNSNEAGSGEGSRIVGKNWQFLSKYITNDSDDKTSVTGDNKNQSVEYIIDISPSNIRAIRSDTKNNDLNISDNKRRVYAQLDRVVKNSKDSIEEYKSKFMHNSAFTGLFVSKHRGVTSTFTP